MLFWIIAALIALIITLFLGAALLRGQSGEVSPAAYDLKVYRDQLKEVDRDLARGVIASEDAERTRTEISRRILTADAQLQKAKSEGDQPKTATYTMTAIVALFLVGGGLFAYTEFGAPGYADQPLQDRFAAAQTRLDNRPSQAAQEAALGPSAAPQADSEFLTLMEELRAKVAERPDDLQGHQLLVRNEATLGNFKAAYEAQQVVIALKGDEATASDYTQFATLMIRAAQGYISPEADTALRAALDLDPTEGFARYYLGSMLFQNGRPDMTFRIWRNLLNDSPANAPWIDPIRTNIEELAWFAGVDYTLPPAAAVAEAAPLRGPTAEDIEAASELDATDQAAMIRGMVSGLSDRLATEGGTPQEWAQLIMAYGVLGETEQATAILDEAQTVFAGNSEALAVINGAASRSGLAQ